MRLKLLQAIALASVTLFPHAGEASLISSDSAIPGITSAVNSDDHATTGESSSLVDDSGTPVLLVLGSDAFDHQDGQDKLRDWSGIFAADGSSCCGGGGGGIGGGLPGLGSFSVPSLDGITDVNLNLDLNLDLNIPLGECCDCNECGGGSGQTVPEPSTFVLAASGLALGLRRAMSGRGGAGVRG